MWFHSHAHANQHVAQLDEVRHFRYSYEINLDIIVIVQNIFKYIKTLSLQSIEMLRQKKKV